MIVDLMDKLIDRCIELVRQKQEVHRSLFDDFVRPALIDFDAVHNDYFASFQKYRKMIEESDRPLTLDHPVFLTLREDSLFSHGKRQKVAALQPLAADPIVGSFIGRICAYLQFSDARLEELADTTPHSASRPPLRNVIRAIAAERLSKATLLFHDSLVGRPPPRIQGMAVLNELVLLLQERYADVLAEDESLRAKLLLPTKA
jgi:hypothetical protein